MMCITHSRMTGASSSVLVVSSGTVLIRAAATRSGRDHVETEGEGGGGGVYSNIRVVQELTDRVVYPCAYLPRFVQYKGGQQVWLV